MSEHLASKDSANGHDVGACGWSVLVIVLISACIVVLTALSVMCTRLFLVERERREEAKAIASQQADLMNRSLSFGIKGASSKRTSPPAPSVAIHEEKAVAE